MTTLTTTKKQAEIVELLKKGIESWLRAGELLCEELDAGTPLSELQEATGINPRVLEQLERIGRKQVMPQLLIADYPAARKVERLPYSEQERLTRESIPLLLPDGDIINIEVHNATRGQARQIFASGHVRSLAEQKAYLKENAPINIHEKIEAQYTISRGRVIFHTACEMTRQTMVRILAEMEG